MEKQQHKLHLNQHVCKTKTQHYICWCFCMLTKNKRALILLESQKFKLLITSSVMQPVCPKIWKINFIYFRNIDKRNTDERFHELQKLNMKNINLSASYYFWSIKHQKRVKNVTICYSINKCLFCMSISPKLKIWKLL